MYSQNLRLSKTWFNHSLRSLVSEHPLTINILKNPKLLWNLHVSIFTIFYISLEGTYLENISLSDIRNLRGVCYYIDCRWQGSFLGLWEFAATDTNTVILKTNDILSIFVHFLQYKSNFRHFEEKTDRRSSSISLIKDCFN